MVKPWSPKGPAPCQSPQSCVANASSRDPAGCAPYLLVCRIALFDCSWTRPTALESVPCLRAVAVRDKERHVLLAALLQTSFESHALCLGHAGVRIAGFEV